MLFFGQVLKSVSCQNQDPVVSVYCSAAVCLLISPYLNPVQYNVRLTCSTSCSTVERPHNLAAVVRPLNLVCQKTERYRNVSVY